jgi:hypothetical protein
MVALGAALAGPVMMGPPRARADEVSWREFRGRVVVSDLIIAPAASFTSPGAMAAALRRLERATIEASGGFWRLHLYAFLDRAPDGDRLRLIAIDVTDARDRREVRAFDVHAVQGERELPLGDLVLSEDMGFIKGHRYEIAVARGRDDDAEADSKGKADVYAKGVITLR